MPRSETRYIRGRIASTARLSHQFAPTFDCTATRVDQAIQSNLSISILTDHRITMGKWVDGEEGVRDERREVAIGTSLCLMLRPHRVQAGAKLHAVALARKKEMLALMLMLQKTTGTTGPSRVEPPTSTSSAPASTRAGRGTFSLLV